MARKTGELLTVDIMTDFIKKLKPIIKNLKSITFEYDQEKKILWVGSQKVGYREQGSLQRFLIRIKEKTPYRIIKIKVKPEDINKPLFPKTYKAKFND